MVVVIGDYYPRTAPRQQDQTVASQRDGAVYDSMHDAGNVIEVKSILFVQRRSALESNFCGNGKAMQG